MTPAGAILAVALALPPPVTPRGYTPETPEAYRARITTIAEAIAAVSDSPEDAAAVLVVWYEESRFDPLIHAGLVHPKWTQDHGRARCLGQLHRTALAPEWETSAGTDIDATTRCARATLRALNSAAWRCASGRGFRALSMRRVFAGYASGMSCEPTRQSLRRGERWASVVLRLVVQLRRED